MRRTSFVGALVAIAIGAVFAFAVRATPNWLDLQQAGFIVLLGGAADLIVRFLIADNPLLSPPAAEVAAVVEPLGDPVLNAAGSPVSLPPDIAAAPVVATTVEVPADGFETADPWQHSDIPAAHDRAVYERALLAAAEGGTLDTPESAVPMTTITGRPVRPHARGARRAAKRSRRNG